MNYPDDFNTPAFPAGRWIALSRAMAIWVMALFLVVLGCCIALPWLQKNKAIDPFVVYVDGGRGEWKLVGGAPDTRVTYYYSVQRALVGVFTKKWFTIFSSSERNEDNWASCNRADVCAKRIPTTSWDAENCGIYCIADEKLYQRFVADVLPIYRERSLIGERWRIDANKMRIQPFGKISQNGGTWVVRGVVRSNLNNEFNIVAYVNVGHDAERYPQTLGYYITGYNAFRNGQ